VIAQRLGSREPPPELGPIPLELQRADVRTVCRLLGLDGDAAWPSRPAEGLPLLRPSVWGPWLAVPASQCLRVSDWHRMVPWDGQQRGNYLLLSVVAARLDGWDYAQHKWYPKRTVPFFRRAAWLLRDLGRGDALFGRLLRALNLGGGIPAAAAAPPPPPIRGTRLIGGDGGQ
jgi:hypothetical protein